MQRAGPLVMSTLLYSHPVCADHDPGPGHPESPGRLRSVLAALEGAAFKDLVRRDAPRADRGVIERVHPAAYVDRVLAAVPHGGRAELDGEPDVGQVYLDGDTVLSPASGEAALRAVGAVVEAVDRVMAGAAANAFCAIRPPGHHAEPDRAMGFCLFNNVAIGAFHAHAVHGCERIAVVDFDVHHGNGTEAAFLPHAHLFYASTHQFPAYPGTGARDETGPLGNIVNVTLAPGTGGPAFRAAYDDIILPRLRDFAPDFLLISAGFDAHAADPLAQINLTEDDFIWVTGALLDVAGETAAGRVVSVLEGGYDLGALGRSAAGHVAALMARK